MEHEHEWLFMEKTDKHENYIEHIDGRSIAKQRILDKEYATFICHLCGTTKKIEILEEVK